MDDHRFDDLTRKIAGGVSRRRAFKLFGGVVGGGLAAALGGRRATRAGVPAPDGPGECARDCIESNPPGPARGECVRACNSGGGGGGNTCTGVFCAPMFGFNCPGRCQCSGIVIGTCGRGGGAE